MNKNQLVVMCAGYIGAKFPKITVKTEKVTVTGYKNPRTMIRVSYTLTSRKLAGVEPNPWMLYDFVDEDAGFYLYKQGGYHFENIKLLRQVNETIGDYNFISKVKEIYE